jgi:hypothetical protein
MHTDPNIPFPTHLGLCNQLNHVGVGYCIDFQRTQKYPVEAPQGYDKFLDCTIFLEIFKEAFTTSVIKWISFLEKD